MKNARKFISLMVLLCLVVPGLLCLPALAGETETPEGSVSSDPEDSGVETIRFAAQGANPYVGQLNCPFGYRFTLDDSKKLTSIRITDFATYANPVNRGSFRLYRWAGSYSATVAAEPLYAMEVVDHADHCDLVITLPQDLRPTGALYFEVVATEGTAYTPWMATGNQSAPIPGKVTDMQAYMNGREASPFACEITIADMVTVPSALSFATFSYDFSGKQDMADAFGITEKHDVEIASAPDGTYATFTSTGEDPYFRFGDGFSPEGTGDLLAFAVIKYRTTADIASGEFFTNRSGGAHWGDAGTYVTWPYVNDGLWHTVIVDTRSAWGQASGETLYAFRFDPLASGARAGDVIDVAYIRFFSTQLHASAYAEEENQKLGNSGSSDLPVTPGIFQAQFQVEGRTVYTVTFRAGDTSLEEPVVPHIPGYTGVWEDYTLGDADLTVRAVYTPVDSSTEPPLSQETDAPMPDTNPETQTAALPAQSSEGTDAESSPAPGGCTSSALSAVAVMILPAGLLPALCRHRRNRHSARRDGT